MTAPSLFEFDFTSPAPTTPLQRGDIVRQRGTLAGRFTTVFPFWQVLGPHPDTTPLRPLWLCRAVPVSAYPGQLHVFEPGAVERTGHSWRVPDHDEIETWLREEWGLNTFLAALNMQPDGTHFYYRAHWEASGARGEVVREHPRLTGGVFVRLPLLSAEAELLALLGDAEWQCGAVTR